MLEVVDEVDASENSAPMLCEQAIECQAAAERTHWAALVYGETMCTKDMDIDGTDMATWRI